MGSMSAAVQPHALWNSQKNILQKLFHNLMPQTVEREREGREIEYFRVLPLFQPISFP